MEVVPHDVRPALGGTQVRPKTGDHLVPMRWPLTPKRIRLINSGDGEHDAMRNVFTILDGESFIDDLRPRLQGPRFVVDVGRTIEIVGLEVQELFLRGPFVLRHHDATRQSEESR